MKRITFYNYPKKKKTIETRSKKKKTERKTIRRYIYGLRFTKYLLKQFVRGRSIILNNFHK